MLRYLYREWVEKGGGKCRKGEKAVRGRGGGGRELGRLAAVKVGEVSLAC